MHYESDNNDDDDEYHHEDFLVPPPPPHIELLNLGCYGHCISHVISYLDGKSRKAAYLSCTYFRDAVAQCAIAAPLQLDRDEERTVSIGPEEPIVRSPSRVADIDALLYAHSMKGDEFKSNDFKNDQDCESYGSSKSNKPEEEPRLEEQHRAQLSLAIEFPAVVAENKDSKEARGDEVFESFQTVEDANQIDEAPECAASAVVENAVANINEPVVKRRNILEEMDDLEQDISMCPSSESVSSFEEQKDGIEPQEGITLILAPVDGANRSQGSMETRPTPAELQVDQVATKSQETDAEVVPEDVALEDEVMRNIKERPDVPVESSRPKEHLSEAPVDEAKSEPNVKAVVATSKILEDMALALNQTVTRSRESAAKERTVLNEPEDQKRDISEYPQMDTIPAPKEENAEEIYPYGDSELSMGTPLLHTRPSSSLADKEKKEQDPMEVPAPLNTPLHEEENAESDSESISTMDRMAQTNSFLLGVNSSGRDTPVSFLSSENIIGRQEEKMCDSNDKHDSTFVDELSVLPTVSICSSGTRLNISNYGNCSPMTQSPVTPIIATPSPVTLLGATRLVVGSSSHLGGGSHQVRILGNVKSSSGSAAEAVNSRVDSHASSNANSESTSESRLNSLGSKKGLSGNLRMKCKEANEKIHQPPQMPKHLMSFTQHVHDVTPQEEIPFDEMPKPARGTSHVPELSSSNRRGVKGSRTHSHKPRKISDNASDISFGLMSTMPNSKLDDAVEDHPSAHKDFSNEIMAPDVLAQFSDAALFGETPQIVTDIMSDIVDGAKSAVSHLYLNRRRNNIDDDGPIKIGDNYYSHNEALRLWRKAKVKLEDRYQQIDEEGNVKMERATFFENSSIFKEDDEKNKTKVNESTDEGGKTDEISIDKMVKTYRILEKNEKKGKKSRFAEFDERTALAGDIKSNEGDSKLLPLKESNSPPRISLSLSPVLETGKKEMGTSTNGKEELCIGSDNKTNDTKRKTIESNTSGVFSDTMKCVRDSVNSGQRGSQTTESVGSNNENANDLNEGIKLARGRAFVGGDDETKTNVPLPTKSTLPTTSTNTLNIDTESVAGKDSIPSHMGSNYGVEVASIRGMSCNFIKGKSSEQVEAMGEKSVQKGCTEQSVLGSQYGTEVLFKPKSKFATARKPRTLASHNMSVKKAASAKQGATVKQNNNNAAGRSSARGIAASVMHSRQVKQTTDGNTRGMSSASGRQQQRSVAPTPSSTNNSTKNSPSRKGMTRLQKTKSMKPNIPLILKLGKKKTSKI